MDNTSAEYLQSLTTARDDLVGILNDKNVEATSDESLDGLIDKVNGIHGGVEFGEWVPTVNTSSFSVSGLPFAPYKIGLSCEALAGQSLYGETLRFISLFSANMGETVTSIYSGTTGEAVMSNVPQGAVVTVTAEENGTYTVTVDFGEWNEVSDIAYMFKGGYEYIWVTAKEEWSL